MNFFGSKVLMGALVTMVLAAISPRSEASAQIVVNLRGTAHGYDRYVSDADGDGQPEWARCFDVDLLHLPSKVVIGKATDCLSNIEVDAEGGIRLVGTTFFRLRHGTLVSRGLTSVQATTHGSHGFTHITGAVPGQGDNSVLRGTGSFKNASGTVRLSGAVAMTPDGPNGPITFDCIFVIDLD